MVGWSKTESGIIMAMKLTKTERDRLSALNSGRGKRRGTDVFTARPCKYKIRPEQVVKIKRCLESGMYYKTILREPDLDNLSEYHIKSTKNGRYDHLLQEE